jgi:cytochrome oxidase Cu insertion factor (SCO1/SenC/PrrC family)
MNTKFVAIFALAVALVAGSLFVAHAQSDNKLTPADPRIDKLMEKSDQILKNQDEILKQLADIKEGVLQVRRRSS